MVDAIQGCLVNFMDIGKDLVLASLIEHLQLMVDRDAWQLLSRVYSLSQLPNIVAHLSNLVSMAHRPVLA